MSRSDTVSGLYDLSDMIIRSKIHPNSAADQTARSEKAFGFSEF